MVAYMGDDERFDYLYKFVAKHKYRPGKLGAARRHNLRLLTEGDLYVARFSGEPAARRATISAGGLDPADAERRVVVPGMTRRGGAGLHPAGRRPGRGHADGPLRGRRAQPRRPARSTSPAPTTPIAGSAPASPARTPPIRGRSTRTATSSRSPSDRNRAGATTSPGTSCCSAATPIDSRCRPTSPAGTGRSRRSRAPTTSRSIRRTISGSPRTAQPGTIAKADGLFRVPLEGAERGHVQQFLAVPTGPRPAAR